MPRIRLSQDYWELLLKDELRKIRQADIGDALGIDRSNVSRRLETMNFTLPELVTIIRKTDMSVDALRKVVDAI